jgi:hypothetical protein
MGRLQNPESEAVYASYMVRFVCFYLRVLADEEQRIIRFRQQHNTVAIDDDGNDDSNSDNDSDDSNSDSNNEKGSEADDDIAQPRRRTRSQQQVDMMNDARELFEQTRDQKSHAIRLWDALDSSDRAGQMEALIASISSFNFTEYHPVALSTGLIQFLAVLGIDSEMARLQTAKNCSYMLAGMLYCMRVIALTKLLPASQRETQTIDSCSQFLSMRHKYLADGTFTLMSEVLNMLAYGKYVGLTAGNSGNAYWSEDKKTFYLNSQPILVSCFCKTVQDLVVETSEKLWELCWINDRKDRVALDLKQVVDDVTFTKRRTSFVDAPGNNLPDGHT